MSDTNGVRKTTYVYWFLLGKLYNSYMLETYYLAISIAGDSVFGMENVTGQVAYLITFALNWSCPNNLCPVYCRVLEEEIISFHIYTTWPCTTLIKSSYFLQ